MTVKDLIDQLRSEPLSAEIVVRTRRGYDAASTCGTLHVMRPKPQAHYVLAPPGVATTKVVVLIG